MPETPAEAARPAPSLRTASITVAVAAVILAGLGMFSAHLAERARRAPDHYVATGPNHFPNLTSSLAPFRLPDYAPVPTPAPTTYLYPQPWTAVPVGGLLPADRPVSMRGDAGERMEVGVATVEDPARDRDPDRPAAPEIRPALGHRLVSVTVRVENTGAVPFLDDLESYAWVIDETGHPYAPSAARSAARQSGPAAVLGPRARGLRTMIFEVPRTADLTRFRLGRAGQIQDWRLA